MKKASKKQTKAKVPDRAMLSLGPKGMELIPIESGTEGVYATPADLDQTATLLHQVLDARSRALNDSYNRLADLVEENRKMGLGRVLANTWRNVVANAKWGYWLVKQSLHRSIE